MTQFYPVMKKLDELNLTYTGKALLSVFKEKAIYKAMDFQRRKFQERLTYPFNYFYAFCAKENLKLGRKPNFEALECYPDMFKTEYATDKEKLDFKIIHEAEILYDKKDKYSYGKKKTYRPPEYTDTYIPKKMFASISYNDPLRYKLDPLKELQKAIDNGNINKKGLQFLKGVYYCSNPKLIEVIDSCLDSYIPEDKDTATQTCID